MAIGFFNQDSSFFEILVGNENRSEILKNRMTSFTVTEEMNRLFNGSIETFDPHSTITDRLLIMGSQIKVSWGYKRPDSSLLAAFAKRDNPNEVTGQFKRNRVNAFIQNVSGSGGADGVMMYSANFMGTMYNTGGKTRTFNSGTREEMVKTVLRDMGIRDSNFLVNFRNGKNILDGNTAKTQYESNFRFLNRMALEHGTVFAIGSGGGRDYAVFADYGSKEIENFSNLVGSSSGNQLTLNYKEGTPNVESYSFEQQASNATGDSAQIMMIGGQVTIKRFKANSQTVSDYKINMKKLQEDMRKQGGAKNTVKFMSQLLSVNSVEKLAEMGYFIGVTETTAPQGYGWTAKVRMLGNPLVTAPMRVKFGLGFPSIMSSMTKESGSKSNFWIRSVTHIIDQNGYHMDLDIADALTISGGSFVA